MSTTNRNAKSGCDCDEEGELLREWRRYEELDNNMKAKML